MNALVAEAAPADLDSAREALRLIQARGFHRDKDLLGELDDILRPAR